MRLAFWRKPEPVAVRQTLEDAMWRTVEVSICNQPELWKLSDGGHWLINSKANFALWVANKDYGMRGWALEEGVKHPIEQHGRMPNTPSKWAAKIWDACRHIVEAAKTEEELSRYTPVLEGFERTIPPLRLVSDNEEKYGTES